MKQCDNHQNVCAHRHSADWLGRPPDVCPPPPSLLVGQFGAIVFSSFGLCQSPRERERERGREGEGDRWRHQPRLRRHLIRGAIQWYLESVRIPSSSKGKLEFAKIQIWFCSCGQCEQNSWHLQTVLNVRLSGLTTVGVVEVDFKYQALPGTNCYGNSEKVLKFAYRRFGSYAYWIPPLSRDDGVIL